MPGRPLHAAFLLLPLLGGLLLAACDRPPEAHQLSGSTMGTTWSVQFIASPDSETAELRQDIEAALETVNAQMSTYREDSDLSRFNRSDAGDRVELPADFARVLETALELAEQTGGAYDPTVGPLVNLWGFGPDGPRSEPPPESDIEAARGRVGWQKLDYEPDSGGLTQPGGVYLDFSSIAKGYGSDLMAEVLERRGIGDYLVQIGGDMRIRGHRADGERWRIAVERPAEGERSIHSVIQPGDQAMATSGSYRNFFRDREKTFSHTIDPRTGYPIPEDLVSVTVLADSAKQADALATAINVLGPDDGYAFARQRELAVLLLIRDGDRLRERMTPAFAAYVAEGAD